MENSPTGPQTPESGDSKESKDSKDSKKTKSAEALGAFIIEPKAEKADDKPQSILERLTGNKDREAPKEADEEAPLEHISDEERQYVETELVGTARQESPANPSADPETVAAEAAVNNFRDKIEDGEDSETAFTETLDEIAQEEQPPAEESFVDLRNEDDMPEPIVLGGTGTPPLPGPEDVPSERTTIIERRAPGEFFAGNAVGYLVGRRSGRIKTEKQLLPVQKKLEKQVTALKTELERKEEVIRTVAVEKLRVQNGEVVAPLQSLEKRQPSKAVPLERIGKVVVDAETVAAVASSREAQPKRVSPIEGLTEKDIVTLNRQELLTVSEKIIIEGTSLRHIYETNLVGEKGLRRLVAEFLRGGNLNKALKRELVEKEIDFERDPILRDKNRGGGTDGGGTHLEALLKKVDNLPGGDSGEMAVLKARAAHEAAGQAKRQQRRKTADISIAAIIAILLAAITTLLISR
ncbi:MAG: hypothetical protein JWO41_423 [Candidatus Saccharibacteria bacterium]|nr:hypothetical protein [Candidatus Saccharibacteria bacterium]